MLIRGVVKSSVASDPLPYLCPTTFLGHAMLLPVHTVLAVGELFAAVMLPVAFKLDMVVFNVQILIYLPTTICSVCTTPCMERHLHFAHT